MSFGHVQPDRARWLRLHARLPSAPASAAAGAVSACTASGSSRRKGPTGRRSRPRAGLPGGRPSAAGRRRSRPGPRCRAGPAPARPCSVLEQVEVQELAGGQQVGDGVRVGDPGHRDLDRVVARAGDDLGLLDALRVDRGFASRSRPARARSSVTVWPAFGSALSTTCRPPFRSRPCVNPLTATAAADAAATPSTSSRISRFLRFSLTSAAILASRARSSRHDAKLPSTIARARRVHGGDRLVQVVQGQQAQARDLPLRRPGGGCRPAESRRRRPDRRSPRPAAAGPRRSGRCAG